MLPVFKASLTALPKLPGRFSWVEVRSLKHLKFFTSFFQNKLNLREDRELRKYRVEK